MKNSQRKRLSIKQKTTYIPEFNKIAAFDGQDDFREISKREVYQLLEAFFSDMIFYGLKPENYKKQQKGIKLKEKISLTRRYESP